MVRSCEVGAEEMSEETAVISITIPIFRNDNGRHVCRLDSLHTCPYLGASHFGTRPMCLWGEANPIGNWDDNAMGYLKPICGIVALVKS